jgi:hypothetical protein
MATVLKMIGNRNGEVLGGYVQVQNGYDMRADEDLSGMVDYIHYFQGTFDDGLCCGVLKTNGGKTTGANIFHLVNDGKDKPFIHFLKPKGKGLAGYSLGATAKDGGEIEFHHVEQLTKEQIKAENVYEILREAREKQPRNEMTPNILHLVTEFERAERQTRARAEYLADKAKATAVEPK